MHYRVVFFSKARVELLESVQYYEEKQKGLGDRFSQSVFEKIQEMLLAPRRYPIKTKNFREARIRSFPYLLVYAVDIKSRSILIVSVFHTSRNPAKKYR